MITVNYVKRFTNELKQMELGNEDWIDMTGFHNFGHNCDLPLVVTNDENTEVVEITINWNGHTVSRRVIAK